ncbi:MAG: glycosyltransferase family 4 protein [Bacteroidota bacterium]|nr:glycosyltransferase family 4 protein [Bacteroidota bacterium]
MNILVYYQNHYHTVFLESLCEGFIKRGHSVQLLTTCSAGQLHKEMEKLGVRTYSYTPGSINVLHYIKHFTYLIRFCKAHNIDVVYSHLQFSNLIALLSQYFISAKVFPCRHHSNEVMILGNKNALRIDKLVSRFAKRIIVVSSAVKEQMIKHEGVSPQKIQVIHLGYNFNLYHKPDPAIASEIRNTMNCKMLLIIISRMTRSKQHVLAAQVLDNLLKKKLDVKMIMMDQGKEKERIVEFLRTKGIEDKVLFTGFVNNTMNYLNAADLLVHPSFTEASNQVVKEAALLNKPSIVCKRVGDFEEYIVNEQNGFLVDPNNLVNEMTEMIEKYYTRIDDLKKLGSNIHDTVITRFSIDPVCDQYLELAV